jgi:mannose-binding lectin
MPILYAQTSGVLKTNSATPADIPGLSFPLTRGVGEMATIILNVPNVYAEGNGAPAGKFFIGVNRKVLEPYASFSSGPGTPKSPSRVSATLVVAVELMDAPQEIIAMWSGVDGSTVVIESPATLSAIV